MRDLRKIKQIKSALNEQFRSVLEHKAVNRSISDSSEYASTKSQLKSALKLPAVEKRGGRQRVHSDVGPIGKLLTNERTRLEKLGGRNQSTWDTLPEEEHPRKQSVQMPKLNSQDDECSWQDGIKSDYKTNQELREDILIKSRFNQLGSKFVGKEIIDKKRSGTSLKGLTRNPSTEHAVRQKKISFVNNDDTMKGSTDITSLKMSDLSLNGPSVEDYSNISDSGGSLAAGRATKKENPLHKNDANAREGRGGTKLAPLSTVKSNGSLHPQTSTRRAQDSDFTNMLQDALLPTIPLELQSRRRSKESKSLERAFLICRQVNSENKDLKRERKRRFANLVDLVIKQRKVINAWEPLMRNVGDIQSDDEV